MDLRVRDRRVACRATETLRMQNRKMHGSSSNAFILYYQVDGLLEEFFRIRSGSESVRV